MSEIYPQKGLKDFNKNTNNNTIYIIIIIKKIKKIIIIIIWQGVGCSQTPLIFYIYISIGFPETGG